MRLLVSVLFASYMGAQTVSGTSGQIPYSTSISIDRTRSCDSITHVFQCGWRSVDSAPHDGTVVEMMQTYGVAPWYGLFKWSKDGAALGQGGQVVKYVLERPEWVSVDSPGTGVVESACLFWRPYKGAGKYVDPTNGFQNKMAYTCAALHLAYDAKRDRCVYKNTEGK